MQGSSSSSGTGSPKLGDARAASAYNQLVGSAFSRVVERLGKLDSGIFVFAPCGCSRAELLKRLMEPGEQVISHAYVYEGFEEKTGDVQSIVKYESLVDLVGKLKGWSGGARIAVVPESSCEAVALKQMLEKEAPYLRVQLLYLPQLYREAAERYSGDVKELARVEHSKLGEVYKCKAEGYSSTLLRAWSSEKLEELRKAKEAILELSPGRLGLRDYLAEAAGKMLIALAAAPFGAAVALAVDRLLAALASLNLQGAAQALLAKVGGVPVKQAEGFASRVLEGWSRPEARNKVAEGLARLVAAAREAAPHLDREELEAVVDQVALEWGMDASTFNVFVENLAKMASGELVTREELRKELEKLVGKELEERLKRLIEDRLREIEEELNKLKSKVEALEIGVGLFYAGDLEKGSLYSNFKVEKGRPVIASLEEKGKVEAELVTAGPFEKLAGEVVRRLEGDFVVLEGPKGIGKSTLAAYTAWRALLNGQIDAILSVSKLDVGKASRLENLVRDAGKRFLVLYDPSPLQAYYKPGAYAREVREAFERSSVGSFLVEETLRELLTLKGVERASVLVVLPDDVYRSVIERNPELKDELERYTLRVDLHDPQFLEEVVKAYSGCTGSFKELAESIARFEGGYTLVAKYAGLTLREKKCSVEDVQTALREAKGKPKLFLTYYLWSVLLKGSGDLAMMAAAPLILHAVFGPIPEGATYLVKAALEGGGWRLPDPERLKGVRLRSLKVEELKPLAKWLSVLHEDLVEEMLEELCSLEYRELEELTGALGWAWHEILREEEEVPVPERLPDFVGKRLAAALEAYASSCWRRLALVAGSALAWHPRAPLVAASQPKALPSEALEPCEADDYLLAGGVIPPLILRVALYSPHTLARPLARCYKEAAEEIKELEKTWRERGARPDERFYALGLALSVAEARGLGEGVEAWEAEAALVAAAAAVQRVSRAECAAAVLEMFKLLGELAPHYHVALASFASELPKLDEDAVREISDAVDGALQKHGEELEGKAWPLVEAVRAYSNLLGKHAGYFREKLELMRGRMCGLLSKLEGQLRAIAEALALLAALEMGLEPCGGGEAAKKAVALLEKLERMEGEEPSGQAVEWARVRAFKPERFKLLVKTVRGILARALASYTMDNDDLDAAEGLFESAAAIARELGTWGNYLAVRSRAARCSALKAGSLEELKERAKIFASLWSEAKERERATASLAYLRNEALVLAEYLVSLALEGRVDEFSKLLDEEGWLLRRFPDVGVAVRLLLGHLEVEVEKPREREVAEALRGDIDQVYRSAFNLLMGLPEGVLDECSELKDRKHALTCLLAVAAVLGDGKAAGILKSGFLEGLNETVDDRLKSLTQGSEEREAVERFHRELQAFVEKRDAGTVVQLLAPANSLASFVLMLWALSSGDEELARAHAKLVSITIEEKLPRRLFREAAEARGERFELALLKLFYLHF
ncbi:MAG: hypothetical protein LM590_04780 [Thermofilum sp.]|nr:hypothetical protein [Thermofilum sp.]